MVDLICPHCNNPFQRENGEVNRSRKLGRVLYCTRSCAGKGNLHNLGPRLGNPEFLVRGYDKSDDFSPFRTALKIAKSRAQQTGKDFDLTLQNLKDLWESQDGTCPYSGREMDLPKSTSEYNRNCKNQRPYKASLDRIDSSKGYVMGNVQFVSHMANLAKSDYTHEQMENFCHSTRIRKMRYQTFEDLGKAGNELRGAMVTSPKDTEFTFIEKGGERVYQTTLPIERLHSILGSYLNLSSMSAITCGFVNSGKAPDVYADIFWILGSY